MKIGVVMFYDDAIKEYAELNYKINKLYCEKYGFDLHVSHMRTFTDRHPSWEKLPLVLKHLTNYDYLIWVDADAFFYLDSGNILDLIREHSTANIIFSKDMNQMNPYMNCGIFIAKNTQYTIDLLNKLAYDTDLDKHNPYPGWWEQGLMMFMYYHNILDIRNNIVMCDYGILQHFNPSEVSNFSKKPYILHMAGKSNSDRISQSTNYYTKNYECCDSKYDNGC
jgi:hypothetical protein